MDRHTPSYAGQSSRLFARYAFRDQTRGARHTQACVSASACSPSCGTRPARGGGGRLGRKRVGALHTQACGVEFKAVPSARIQRPNPGRTPSLLADGRAVSRGGWGDARRYVGHTGTGARTGRRFAGAHTFRGAAWAGASAFLFSAAERRNARLRSWSGVNREPRTLKPALNR